MALSWKAPFDVNETKDYVRDWSAEMEASGDTVQTATFELPQSAIDAGFRITIQTVLPGNLAAMWITCDTPEAGRALNDTGIPIQHTVVTVNGRTFNETLILRVREK